MPNEVDDYVSDLVFDGTRSLPEWVTNRMRKTEPKRGKIWCPRCDRNHIGEGERCSVCGFKDTFTKRRKK